MNLSLIAMVIDSDKIGHQSRECLMSGGDVVILLKQDNQNCGKRWRSIHKS